MSSTVTPPDPARMASEWFAMLASGTATDHDVEAWRAWCQAHPDHQAAWDVVEQIKATLAHAPATLTREVLSTSGDARRRLLRTSAAIVIAAPLAAWLVRESPARAWFADYRTPTGQQRDVRLPDGSLLSMNTETAVDVRFDGAHRHVTLREGEIVLTGTAPLRAAGPPLRVETRHGVVMTPEARLAVRVENEATTVSVFTHAAEVVPRTSMTPLVLTAGQRLRFDQTGHGLRGAADEASTAWRHGSIVALDMPLGQLLGELSRYRPGVVRCAPDIAGIKVSGAFPVTDTDKALAAIERSFPVTVHRLGPWWVTVEAA